MANLDKSWSFFLAIDCDAPPPMLFLQVCRQCSNVSWTAGFTEVTSAKVLILLKHRLVLHPKIMLDLPNQCTIHLSLPVLFCTPNCGCSKGRHKTTKHSRSCFQINSTTCGKLITCAFNRRTDADLAVNFQCCFIAEGRDVAEGCAGKQLVRFLFRYVIVTLFFFRFFFFLISLSKRRKCHVTARRFYPAHVPPQKLTGSL